MRRLKLFLEKFIGSQQFKSENLNISSDELNINLGCGNDYRFGWINIDINPHVKSDIVSDFISIKSHFPKSSISKIEMMHSISYLTYAESQLFFKDIFYILKSKGEFILEFPDIIKCSKSLIISKNNSDYFESVRGIYAFDMDQVKRKEKYIPYSFGWSAEFMKAELLAVGFSTVNISEPLTHGQRLWRDVRIIAIK